ncbi:unnamed protein product (macronuclear) [Paramecium tetraurelia]|uniref:Uncharacterized protein n=1 Tax=Paramecium tetraurelia TaxID=5888 RepID=A0C8N1_PARTE|nr:uncharacterized protein GSPATT00036283001 [Paramecium tetraurelia]CAK67148.1 unnamed protein product [Paramecium tetraurelia]|eukprot:XP_001434545.1 hypothetical protein (macronuclear) [Paramecium tetraurelia strain d4-2]
MRGQQENYLFQIKQFDQDLLQIDYKCNKRLFSLKERVNSNNNNTSFITQNLNQSYQRADLKMETAQNQFTPITHLQVQSKQDLGIERQFQEVYQSSQESNKELYNIKCIHKIKKENQYSSQKKRKTQKRPFQLTRIPECSRAANITLIFRESEKSMELKDYSLNLINTCYQLKQQILCELLQKQLFITQKIKGYIECSRLLVNGNIFEDQMLLNEIRHPILIEIFQFKTPNFNQDYHYQFNHEQVYQNQYDGLRVQNLQIMYNNKQINWSGIVDISHIDFEEILKLENGYELYNINKLGYFRIPNQGKKLNCKRMVKLNVPEELLILTTDDNGNRDKSYLMRKLSEQCKLLNQEFVSLDNESRYYEFIEQ